MKSEMKGALEERVETRCSCLLWAEGSILNLDFPNPPPAPGHQQNEEIKFAQAFPKKSGSGGSAQPSTYHYRALQTYIEI